MALHLRHCSILHEWQLSAVVTLDDVGLTGLGFTTVLVIDVIPTENNRSSGSFCSISTRCVNALKDVGP